ncbi:MAG: peptide deformylase [Candidatus Bathyarchaeota archaeon]|nr:peptide deformylase [Candidatus Bathyarchaeota archaeon]
MTIRDTVLLGDPRLREEAHGVVNFSDELALILEDLKDTLTHIQKEQGMGRGMAAPQIGYPKKVVYIQMPERSFYLVNPAIIWRSPETFMVWDSCFSLNAAFFVKISRNKAIKVEYKDEDGGKHIEEFSDDMSELLQHEIDHLHGVMCTDHLTDLRNIVMKEEWEKRYRTPGIGM